MASWQIPVGEHTSKNKIWLILWCQGGIFCPVHPINFPANFQPVCSVFPYLDFQIDGLSIFYTLRIELWTRYNIVIDGKFENRYLRKRTQLKTSREVGRWVGQRNHSSLGLDKMLIGERKIFAASWKMVKWLEAEESKTLYLVKIYKFDWVCPVVATLVYMLTKSSWMLGINSKIPTILMGRWDDEGYDNKLLNK